AQHAPDELAGQVEVGPEASAARHLVDAVRPDRARADVAPSVRPVLGQRLSFLIRRRGAFGDLRRPTFGGGHPRAPPLIVSGASRPALTTLSYPVHRQRLPASQ